MVTIDIKYTGELHCDAVHGPSQTGLATDAPVDNHGKGESFSPTDLVATALATCMLTTLGIVAGEKGFDIDGASARVVKEMIADPSRRIKSLAVELTLPRDYSARERAIIENTAHTCPVRLSIHPEIDVPMAFHYPV